MPKLHTAPTTHAKPPDNTTHQQDRESPSVCQYIAPVDILTSVVMLEIPVGSKPDGGQRVNRGVENWSVEYEQGKDVGQKQVNRLGTGERNRWIKYELGITQFYCKEGEMGITHHHHPLQLSVPFSFS